MRHHILKSLTAFLILGLLAQASHGFCGFYVAKADTDLFNQASKVVIARDGERTVVTMANDFRGDPTEFAIVIPVPTVLERGQIHVAERSLIDHLDAYTAPRLVEYFDSSPCEGMRQRKMFSASPMADQMQVREESGATARSLGVTIEAEYSVGEYDILILSAKESDGLDSWLRQEGYRLPAGAARVLGSYVKQNMRFFVAKVNLEQQAKLGFSYLRPLQVAYETPKFMLPIRLGTVNADGDQELFVFVLNQTGRVETTNYRTVRLPSDVEVPLFVKSDFGDFYRDLFSHQVLRENKRAVFLEYAWDMGWCDPCAADPLSSEQLRELGVFWLGGSANKPTGRRPSVSIPIMQPPAAHNVFVTRLHLRYNGDTFPEDLFFQETGDRSNFQGRYILRHPWQGSANACTAASGYFEQLAERHQQQANTLANLTGRDLGSIRERMETEGARFVASEPQEPGEATSWWQRIWGEG